MGLSHMLVPRVSAASSLLDIQTGGGEVLAEVLARVDDPPDVLAATESWPPNAEIARRTLALFGVAVAEVPDEAQLPFADGRFELVVSRHPTVTIWNEIPRAHPSRNVSLTAGRRWIQP